MYPNPLVSAALQPDPLSGHPRFFGRLRIAFVCLLAGLLLWISVIGGDLRLVVGAGAVVCAAFLPAFLWLMIPSRGIPLFALFALPAVWCYAVPIATRHPEVQRFSPGMQLGAALSIAFALVLGTLAWWAVIRIPSAPLGRFLCLPARDFRKFFFTALLVSILLNLATLVGWLEVQYGLYSLLRAAIYLIATISLFILGYFWGSGDLTKGQRVAFVILILLNSYIKATGLILAGAVADILVVIIGRTLSSRRFPLFFSGSLLLLFVVLHFGKDDMRAVYWGQQQRARIAVEAIPLRFVQWYAASFTRFAGIGREPPRALLTSDEEQPSFLRRMSLMHMYLEAYSRVDREIPRLSGETYWLIPELFIPRVVYAGKIAAHESMYLLNIHFGRQTRESALRTSIAWGVLAESWANFGLLGVVGVGIIIGLLTGAIERWSRPTPIVSLRALIAMVLASLLFRSEMTLSVLVAASYQAAMGLIAFGIVFMKPRSANT